MLRKKPDPLKDKVNAAVRRGGVGLVRKPTQEQLRALVRTQQAVEAFSQALMAFEKEPGSRFACAYRGTDDLMIYTNVSDDGGEAYVITVTPRGKISVDGVTGRKDKFGHIVDFLREKAARNGYILPEEKPAAPAARPAPSAEKKNNRDTTAARQARLQKYARGRRNIGL